MATASKTEMLKLLKNTMQKKHNELNNAHYEKSQQLQTELQAVSNDALSRVMSRIVQSLIVSAFSKSSIDEFCNALKQNNNSSYYSCTKGLLKEDKEFMALASKIDAEEAAFKMTTLKLQSMCDNAERAIILNGMSDETKKLFEDLFNFVV